MVDVGSPVVVVEEPGLVVVVGPPEVEVVGVVVSPPLMLLVVVDDDGCVVVVVLALVDVVVAPGVLVVVVVDDAGGGVPLITPPKDVPVPAWPKMDDSGFPAISSTPVTTRSATRKTTPAVPAMAFHVKRRGATGAAEADDSSPWVAGVPATAVASSCSVRSAGEADASI